MENTTNLFEATITSSELKDKSVTVRLEETTDGIPLYHCEVGDVGSVQLRREPSGEWTQVWGKLPAETVAQVGRLIEVHQR